MRALLLLLLALPAAGQRAGETGFHIDQWGGLNTYNDSARIADHDAQDLKNILTDRGFLEPMPGTVLSTSIPSGITSTLGHFGADSDTRYLIIHSTVDVYRTDLGSALIKVATVSATSTIDMVPAFSRLYIADGVGGMKQVNADASSSTISGAPISLLIDFCHDRLWAANIPAESGSLVRASSTGGSGYWTVATDPTTVPNSPDAFYIQRDDGEDVQCLKCTKWGVVSGKASSMHIIKGIDNETWRKEVISDTVGCSDDRSMQIHEGRLTWMSRDGVYEWPGAGRPELISRDIDSLMRTIRQGNRALDSWTTTTQAEFEEGSLTPSGPGAAVSATILPGSVVPSSWTRSFVSTAGFSGAFISSPTVSTSTFNNDGIISRMVVGDFGSEGYTASGWTPSFGSTPGSGNGHCGPTGSGTFTFGGTNYRAFGAGCDAYDGTVRIIDTSSNILYQRRANGATTQNCDAYTFDVSTQTVEMRVQLYSGISGAADYFTSTFTASDLVGGIFHYGLGARADEGPICFGQGMSAIFDTFDPYVLPSSTFTTGVYDLGITTPVFSGMLYSSMTINGGTVAVRTLHSRTAAGTFTTSADLTSGITPATKQQFVRFQFVFTSAYSSHTAMVLTSTLTARTTAYYHSGVEFIGTAITAWGQFSVTHDGGGGSVPTYWVRASTSIFDKDNPNLAWTAQPNGADLTIATGSYVQFRGLFNVDSGTQEARIDLVTLNWSEGSATPMASASYKQRYFLCVAIDAASTVNDTCLIYQRNKKWTKLSDLAISALNVFDGALYGGNGSGSEVWKLMQDGLYNFDGAAISSYWISKDFMFAPSGKDWPTGEKVLNELWLDANFSTGTIFNAGYAINKSTTYTSGSLNLGSYGPSVNRRVPLATDWGKYFRFQFSNAQADRSYQLNGYSVYGEPKDRTTD